MGLKHCVITSVDRDDLPRRGASHWAASVRSVRESNPDTTIEVLIPDFDGKEELIDIVLASAPDIVGHNIETVERLTPQVRSRAKYGVSLNVLKHIAGRGATAKSGLMLGLGESEAEVLATMDDLLENGCRILTIGQYLRPTLKHLPVAQYVTPEKFAWYKEEALRRGFTYVESGRWYALRTWPNGPCNAAGKRTKRVRNIHPTRSRAAHARAAVRSEQ